MAKLKTPKTSKAGRSMSHRSTPFKALVAEDRPTGAKIDAIRSGIDARVVNDMVEYFAVSKSEIFAVLLAPASTTHRLIKERRPLDPAASERVVRIAEVTRIAEETFGGPTAAAQWLTTPNLALENATPLSMLDTEPGANDVRRILASITYGGVV
jgi:putative toxin-antitoxin system antitoxin component (TIGR02293 family)